MRIVKEKIKVPRMVSVERRLPDARQIAEAVVAELGDVRRTGDQFRDNFGSMSAMELGWKALEWLPILAAAVLEKPVAELFRGHKFPRLTRRRRRP